MASGWKVRRSEPGSWPLLHAAHPPFACTARGPYVSYSTALECRHTSLPALVKRIQKRFAQSCIAGIRRRLTKGSFLVEIQCNRPINVRIGASTIGTMVSRRPCAPCAVGDGLMVSHCAGWRHQPRAQSTRRAKRALHSRCDPARELADAAHPRGRHGRRSRRRRACQVPRPATGCRCRPNRPGHSKRQRAPEESFPSRPDRSRRSGCQ